MITTKKAFRAVAIVVSMLVCSSVAAQGGSKAGDPRAAADGKISMCIGCHGIPMYQTVFPEVYKVPKIAGQSPEYIVKALQAYRSGERNHPSMVGIAKSLNDQDMADLAAYYGGESKRAQPEPAAAPATSDKKSAGAKK